MMKVCYSELDGPEGLSCRLEAAGHAGFAPAGQDIVCAGASTLMQALVYLLAGEENAHADAWEEPDGPRLAVQADAPCAAWVQGAFELAKAGFTLLAERYPDNIRFADVSRRGEQSMMDLQMFAEEAAPAAPALPLQARNAVRELHARWAAEEADLRRSQPEFRLQEELKNPEMRRLMQLPGMRMRDAYRLAHYDESLHRAAQAVEQGVVQRIQQRAARPAENGIRPGGAATVHPDVASMTRAQREALERRVLHGAQIEL